MHAVVFAVNDSEAVSRSVWYTKRITIPYLCAIIASAWHIDIDIFDCKLELWLIIISRLFS